MIRTHLFFILDCNFKAKMHKGLFIYNNILYFLTEYLHWCLSTVHNKNIFLLNRIYGKLRCVCVHRKFVKLNPLNENLNGFW